MPAQPDQRGAELAIAERHAAFVSALMKRNSGAACQVYTADATMLPPSAGPMCGRSAIQAFWQAGLDAGIAEIELETTYLRCRDDVAYEIGRYKLRVDASEGKTVVDRGNYVLVHERRSDGIWQRAVEMFSPTTDGGQP